VWLFPAAVSCVTPRYIQRFSIYRSSLGTRSETTRLGLLSPAMSSWSGHTYCQETYGTRPGSQWECTSIQTRESTQGACNQSIAEFITITCAEYDPPELLGHMVWTRDNTALGWVNARSGAETTYACGPYCVVDPPAEGKATHYRYSVTANYYSLTPAQRSDGAAPVRLPRPPAVLGYADTHIHQFAHLAFGGAALFGRSGDLDDGSPTYEYSPRFMGGFWGPAESSSLPECGLRHGSMGGGLIDLEAESHGVHGNGRGYPEFTAWPAPTSRTHQQVYKTWLKRAWRGGLRLMVMLAVHNEVLCKLADNTRLGCKDETAIQHQLTAAKKFEEEIAREGGWFRIVYTPGEARQAIQEGKLAVVLGVEVDTPLGCGTGNVGQLGGFAEDLYQTTSGKCGTGGNCRSTRPGCFDSDWLPKLEALYQQGVRHIFPIHFINNGIGGPALFNNDFGLSQYYVNGSPQARGVAHGGGFTGARGLQ
jgi:hypothetical protein